MDIIISSSKDSEKAMMMRLIKYAVPLMAKAKEAENARSEEESVQDEDDE